MFCENHSSTSSFSLHFGWVLLLVLYVMKPGWVTVIQLLLIFVINEAQVPPGLSMCFPAQLTCLGGRKGCWVCEEELGVVLGSEKGTSALDTIVFSVQV